MHGCTAPRSRGPTVPTVDPRSLHSTHDTRDSTSTSYADFLRERTEAFHGGAHTSCAHVRRQVTSATSGALAPATPRLLPNSAGVATTSTEYSARTFLSAFLLLPLLSLHLLAHSTITLTTTTTTTTNKEGKAKPMPKGQGWSEDTAWVFPEEDVEESSPRSLASQGPS